MNKETNPDNYIKDDRIKTAECDGTVKIIASTVTRYGHLALPIYAVKYKYEELPVEDSPEYGYKIFIGECPFKDENGKWTTLRPAVTFIVQNIYGQQYIDDEPDIPHIVRLRTDEEERRIGDSMSESMWRQKRSFYTALDKSEYCTFSTYINGLWNRIKRNCTKKNNAAANESCEN